MTLTKVKEKSIGKKRTMWLLTALLVPVVALILGGAVSKGWAETVKFDEAEIFFELNSTDLDLGLQIFFDAEGWEEVEIRGPNGDIFEVENDGALSDIGSTEVFTESAEPSLCDEDEEDSCDVEAAIQEFQDNFPEGWYRFRGRTVEGNRLRGRAYLSHELPDAPVITSPTEETALENVDAIVWTLGSVDGYEAVFEMVIDGRTFVNTATLPGDATTFTVSPEFKAMALEAQGDGTLEEFKVELIARGENLNKTITEVVVVEEEE